MTQVLAATLQRVRIGTAGWNVPIQFAAEFRSGNSHLERYARQLNAVEINSSFYKPHQHKTYARWAGSTPADFQFSVKIPKAMTHERRLVGCSDLITEFSQQVSGLGGKLAALLVQLPPSFAAEQKPAAHFFATLRRAVDVPVAFEPRHPSWFSGQIERWLAEDGIARVAADPAPVPIAARPGGASTLAYYRWHGSPRVYFSKYDDQRLVTLGNRLHHAEAGGASTWCIFDNTGAGAALGNALSLAETCRIPSGTRAEAT